MKPNLSKVALRYKLSGGSNSSLMRYKTPATDAAQLLAQVRDWLRENGRTEHFVNSYDNRACGTAAFRNGECSVVVVLSNRDTALMLKMAMV